MKSKNIVQLLIFFITFTSFIIINKLPLIISKLTCEPDYKSIGDNYNSLDDPQDETENLYGYEFAHRAGDGTQEYYDHWKGVYWDDEQFCYEAYDNTTRPEDNLDELNKYKIDTFTVLTSADEISSEETSYIILEHDQSNLANLHSQMCMTKNHSLSKYNNGEYELLIKMDKTFEKDYLEKPHHFYFTVENPSDDNITFAFKVRNFVNTTEHMNITLYEYGPNPEECLEEEIIPSTDSESSSEDDEDDDQASKSEEENEDPEYIVVDNPDDTTVPTDPPTQEPCEREIILLNETYLEWTEEYPIPEVFYITNNYTIEPHSSLTINLSLTFKENENTTEKGYYVVSSETGQSDKPFYWPDEVGGTGRLQKLTNMEIILESDLSVGLSSYSLMRRRELEEQSYLGDKCTYSNDVTKKVLNGACGDGYFCDKNETCTKCKKIECKECSNKEENAVCTKCFSISVEGQWNPKGGRANSLTCDLDYIDITKVIINDGFGIEVPPAIHWRVTMDFWIWISDTTVFYEKTKPTNMNIIYKDFMAITLVSTQEGLKIYATPIEWLYEYPTVDNGTNLEKNETDKQFYLLYIKPRKHEDIVDFLSNTVGSYNKVTMEDLVLNPSSKWIYVRYAFNLDSSKEYLNDLPESNLRVPQIYTTQTEMAFHMKKYYGRNGTTHLYFQNFYHPLNEELEDKKNITIYFRNLNIFREYIPQNIITKYHNMHLIEYSSIFPQLMISFPFSGITRKTNPIKPVKFIMKGYNYYVRTEEGAVLDDTLTGPNITEYELKLDEDVESLRPPRNFWRLNLLELNKQPETCDFELMQLLKCESPSYTCFEDNKPFICIEGDNKKPYYLNINNLTCQQYCEYGYMHPPRYSSSLKRLYCSHLCDAGNKQCPSDDYKYTEINSNFLCSNNFFNLYYKCFNKDESINNPDYGGIFFSSLLWTPTIFIDLGKQYEEFAIDFWYLPDDRIRYLKKRYPDYKYKDDYNPDDHLKYYDSEKERIIFLSDCCKVVYGDSKTKGSTVLRFFKGASYSSTPRSIETIDIYNWNHFVLTYFYSAKLGYYTYYLTFKNAQFVDCGNNYGDVKIVYSNWFGGNKGQVLLSQIIFCTFDDKVTYGNSRIAATFEKECKNAYWLDGFYRKLQIFDLKHSTKHPIFYSHEFEDDGLNEMIKHRYIYKLSSVVDNKLIDLIGGRNGYVRVYDKSAEQNPDKASYIIYESNYSPNGGITNWGSANYITGFKYDTPPELEIKSQTKRDEKCLIVQQDGNCLACKPGYSLFSKTCLGEINSDSNPATFFYKNPGKNMPERISLNLDFDKIKNTPYFTIFFFIKIYGFVKDNPLPEDGFVKLIIFHEEKNEKGEIIEDFYLAWTSNKDDQNREKLYFYYNGERLFSYEYFREFNFGQWVPISFAAFRENDRLFQLNMAQASILYENLKIDRDSGGYNGYYFPYIKFTQFSITNLWVGLLSDLKIYNRFVANAWGIVKFQHDTLGDANDDVPDSAIAEIDLKSNSKDTCLLSNQILNQPSSGYEIECVNDNNPHWFRCKGSPMNTQTIRYHQGDGYLGNCTACCGTYRPLYRCLGGHDPDCTSTYYIDQSCETQSPVWKHWYPSLDDYRIRCKVVYYIDYNRFKYAKVEKVASPQDVWAVDFWFYTGTCHAAIKRTGTGIKLDGSEKTNNNNNFREFTLEWNYHIKIRVHAEKTDDVPTNNIYDYVVDCTPIVVLEHQDLNSPEKYTSHMGDRHYIWSFVTCGVNFQEKIFYQTTNNKFSSEIPFTSKLVTIPSTNTYFIFNENSPSGYGFTFIHQLRLWHCYNCAHYFRNLDYVSDDKNFNAVYHCFDGVNNNGAYPTVNFYDSAGKSGSYSMTQAADFPGYTVRRDYGSPVLCDETLYNYYDEESNSCQRHYNLARSPSDFEIDIPSSRNGRYTMDFWFFVESSSELSPGFNLLWKYHISITLLRDTSNRNTINAICFPQSYRDDVDGLGGEDIIDLYDRALNKDKYAFYQGSSKWNFVRCAVDQTRKLFFINDNIQLDLEGEILYGTTRNYRPFRYFKINQKHPLKFQNAHDNPTRIFLRNIKCYKDFIDFRLMDMKFLICSTDNDNIDGWDSCNFWPLSFCFDYSDFNITANWPCTHSRYCFQCNPYENCGLYYFINNENSDQGLGWSGKRWRRLLYYDDDVYYPTFPDIYMPKFCKHGQSGGDKVLCTNSVYHCAMQNTSALFWPRSNNRYLNLETLKEVTKCEKACRPPDTYKYKAYCLIEEFTNNMLNCEYNVGSAENYETYQSSYKCKDNYVKVYYECIDKDIVTYSAMYFSNVYSFPNIVFSASDKSKETLPYQDWKVESRLASYYVEAWIKFDAINYRKDITEIEHYLYAHPHQIIKDPIDQKYKYSNIIISQGSYYYTLTSMSNYEWNKVIIENIYEPDTNLFHIKFFLNYEFDNPELSILNLDGSIYKLHFRGFGFCDKTDSYCRINDEVVYLRWGVAWYRNFRVWDADITSLELIQACEYGYTQLINAQRYYFPLTVDYIYKNTILDRIDPSNKMECNYWVFYQGSEYKSAFDNAMRENYSTDNFDKTYINENNYISGITDDGTDYIISACSDECKRCYSSSNVDCYECRLGYAIYGKQCKVRTGYFFKTPPDNDNYNRIEITTQKNDEDGYFNITEINPLTITLYIKFFGIELDKVITGQVYYPLCCFKIDESGECKIYIGYNYDDKTIVFVVNGREIYASRAKPYIGVWTHFGISIHHQLDNDHFPDMLNFMIDQEVLIPKYPYIKTDPNSFNPTTEKVIINCFTIYTEPICYYSSFKVFSTFYFGPYGHVNAIASTRGNKLVYQINLYGSSNSNCISNADLARYSIDNSINIKILQPVCVSDYQPYEDTNNICSDNDHFMDVIYKTNPPCELCDSVCITNCFHYESNECTCDYYEGLYWVKTDEQYQSYECEKVDSINFAFFEKVTIYGLTVVTNDEMTMAFWLDVYEYLDNKFDSLEIIWNQHLAVIVRGNDLQGDDKYMIIECHGDYDINNPDMAHSKTYDYRLKFNRWNYIVCQADKYHEVIRVNAQLNETYTPVTYSERLLTTSLTIEDKTVNFNYGFSFVRELKLFSSFNFDFWDQSLHNLQKSNFEYLLHSFSNQFSGDKIADSKITDSVEGLVTKLTLKSNRIGYNYVINYKYLVLCEEGYIYNNVTNRCDIYDSQECYIPRNEEKCLICGSTKPYLKDDDQCYSDCSPYYFADDYFQQCRRCHYTCYTCFAKKHNNCLSCTGIYYYIESLHVCITNCQQYGLIISTKLNNTCAELETESYISIPKYLNNSYDYNPKNEDFVSKIINRDEFKEIQGHLGEVSAEVETEWIFNWNKTVEINREYRYFEIDDIPDENPITSDPTNLYIKVDNNFFKYGYKYVFDLEIYSRNGNYSTNHTHTYILMMNDYPLVGQINILPSTGYITNLFLMTINKCKDDVSEKSKLRYKFTYFTKSADVIYGYKNTTENEIIIQDWSANSEVLYQFPELNPEENNKYFIRGYCRDEFSLFWSEIQEVEVYDIPTNSQVDVPLEQALESIDLDEDLTPEQLSNRAEFLATTTVDFEKEGVEIINRTNITDFTKKGIWQQNLILYDPTDSQRDLYCNHRGNSYIEYYYLICDCNGYEGSMCQIDYPSFDSTIEIYDKLFTKVKTMQTIHYNKYLINSVNLLMKSGAAFMPIENMDFMLESIEFINLYRNKFANEMMEGNNYEVYFDIYNSLIEYGLSIVNKLKYRNFIAANSKNAENLYNADKFRNATLNKGQPEVIQNYFNKIKVSLQSLLDFYATNKKQLRFINRNINVYVSEINENFEFDTYFDIEKKLYEPYMDFRRCLESTMIKSQGTPSYRVYLTAITWKVSPYMSEQELYWNTSSPIISFKFLDYDKSEKIYLSNCGSTEDQIQLYFPLNTYRYVERINRQRDYLSPENQFDLNDDIFCDPVYINKSGAVFNTTPEERINQYFLGFNFTCKYYKVSSEDKNDITLTPETLDYHKYTKENYIQCLANKLVQEAYGEFVVDSYLIPNDFHINSRFFYLKHYMLLAWKDNYTMNQAFYYFIVLVLTYAGLSLAYIYFEKKHFIEMNRLASLKSEVAKINIPYRDEYIFNNDLQLEEEIKGKLKNKRKPEMEEMNLDTNNLNVGIMADEISKYNKGYLNKDNALGFNPKYFGIKDKPKTVVNSKYFPGEVDVRQRPDNDEEISPERLDKMKKFYQVGYKGLDVKESKKKEMRINDEKKKIIIGKKNPLDEISEIEEEDFDGPNKKDFYNKNDENEDEKETNIFRKSRHKKFTDMNKYKDFVSSTGEHLESDSNLKNSKRATKTKKFFGSNPPKKEGPKISSMVFTEKDAQKKAKINSEFFGNKLNDNEISKKKEKNIFQKDYDNLYKANFKGPKVVSENLGFYNRDTIDFEQDMDSENKNPPYFGSRFKKKLKDDEDRGKGENAGLRVGFNFKGRQIDLDDNEEQLPELNRVLTFEKRMEEFHSISVPFTSFLMKNLKSRHILITTFDKKSIIYQRYQRAGNFAAQLSMFAFLLSIFFTADAKQTAYVTGNKDEILNFVLYCFLSDVGACIVVHLPAYCFWVNDKKFRNLYNTIREDGGINVLKQTEDIIFKGRIFWNILGIIIQIIYIVMGFYFAFGFCATYYYQRTTFTLAMICTLALDFFVTEFAWEIFIGFLYYFRDVGRVIVFFGTLFNKLRDIKHLAQ